MLGEQNTGEELLTAFQLDAQRWKSTLENIWTETQFIEKLLYTHIKRITRPIFLCEGNSSSTK